MSDGARVVLATRNAHKVVELREILADLVVGTGIDLDVAVVGIADVSEAPDVVESGVTFAENSLLKARAACAATGLPALADDSGLAVDVLGGSPGVFSARWSGGGGDAANVALLLAQLADVPDEHRAAAFVCAASLVTPQGDEVVEHGRLAGILEREPRGTNGFGYDPILRVDAARTLAQLDPAEKNAISHRGQALRALAPHVLALLTEP